MTTEQQIIAELSQRAAKVEKEKGYLLNEADGSILDEQEADDTTPYEVDFPQHEVQQAAREGRGVIYIHSHQIVSPPSERDWGLFIAFSAIQRFVAVCEDRLFFLERTAKTRDPFRTSAETIFLHEQNVLVKKSSVGTLPLKEALERITSDELLDLLCAVNRKMAQTYGVRFEEQKL